MTPAANDEQVNQEQDLAIALHARYLLALKGHRRGAFIIGFFYGAMIASMCWFLWPMIAPFLA